MSRSFAIRLAVIAVCALALRLVYVLAIAKAPVGIGGDAGFYHSAANFIADGRFYFRGIFGRAYHTAEHPPLYPLVLSIGSLLGLKTLTAHRVISVLIGTCGVVLIGVLGRRVVLAGDQVRASDAVRAADRAGLIAAGIAAIYPPFVTADGLVMSEPLFIVMVSIALLVALWVRERPSVPRAALLGAVIGLATLTRGEALALAPLLTWPAVWAPHLGAEARAKGAIVTRAARASPTLGVVRVLAATAALAVVLAPWVVRNAIVFHRAILATDSNTLIAGANCRDTFYGHDIGFWSLQCLAHGRSRRQLDVGDASTGPAVDYATDHLTRLPLVAVARVARTFDLFQPLRQGNHEPRVRWVDVVGLFIYFPVLVLAVCGLFRLRGRRWLLLAPIAMVVLVSAVGWGIGRFRVAADISLIVAAANALSTLAIWPQSGRSWSGASQSGEAPPSPSRR